METIELLLFVAGMGFVSLVLSVLSPRWRMLFSLLATFSFLVVATNVSYIPLVSSTGTTWTTAGQSYRYFFWGLGMVSFVWSIVLALDYLVGGRLLGEGGKEER